MAPEPSATPHTVEDEGTVKMAKHARFFWPILRGMVLTVALCAFVPFLAGILYEERLGTAWAVALTVFVLSTFTLMAMSPRPATLPAAKGKGTAKQLDFPPWSLVSYCILIGLGFNWACVFLWFSRRYAFFSAPVAGVTSLILALYAAIALLLARLTNWRIALIFAIAACAMGGVVLRLGLLR